MTASASEHPGADDGLRVTAAGEPDGQRVLHRPRVHRLVHQRRAEGPGPGHALVVAQREEQVELLGEQGVVVGEVVAEQREGLGGRAAPGHHLGTTARQAVEGGELLEHAHGVVGAEYGDGAGQPDPPGAGGRGGEDGRGAGGGLVGAVVLADAEHVEPHLVGELGLLDDLAQPRGGADAGRGEIDVRERVRTEFHDALNSGGAVRFPGRPTDDRRCRMAGVAGRGHWVELRVHGVRATAPEDMLDVDRVVQVAGDELGRVLRRADRRGDPLPEPDGHVVEAYHWGRLTSGSSAQGLWLLLAPFGLANAAQFACRGRRRPPSAAGTSCAAPHCACSGSR